MSRLPPSTNHLSRGSLASVWFLGLYSLLELITGLIHFLLPDGDTASARGQAAGFAWSRHSHPRARATAGNCPHPAARLYR